MSVGLTNVAYLQPQIKKRADNLKANEAADTASTESVERELLWQIANSGDSKALESFYHIYRRRLGPFLYRMISNSAIIEEVLNDVMHIVWQKAHQFNGTSKVSTWVYSIAYRNCLQGIRKEKKHQVDSCAQEQAYQEDNETENKELIEKALQLLSAEHRLVIELSYFAGSTYSEIAEIADCPEATVKTRMYYARRKLQDIMTKLGEVQLSAE